METLADSAYRCQIGSLVGAYALVRGHIREGFLGTWFTAGKPRRAEKSWKESGLDRRTSGGPGAAGSAAAVPDRRRIASNRNSRHGIRCAGAAVPLPGPHRGREQALD